MKLNDLLQARNILIYGFGIEGRAAKQFLDRHAPQAAVTIHVDADPTYNTQKAWQNFDVVVLSSGIPRTKIPAAFQGRVTSNVDLFFDNLPEEIRRKTIGITGTKGKSTTAKFCGELFQKAGKRTVLAGNYGVGLLSILEDAMQGTYDFIVIELSSYQLEYISISPGIAIFLNLYPDHLDRHLTIENYQAAKMNIWRHQRPGDLLIFPESWRAFAEANRAGQESQTVLFAPPLDGDLFPSGSVFRAPYLRANLGTIAVLARRLKLPETALARTARDFIGLPHRLEKVASVNGITFYDDAISTNPDSTLPTVIFLNNRLGSIILGGQDRGQDFTKLVDTLVEQKVAVIVYDSETAPRLRELFSRAGYRSVSFIKHFKDAVAKALEVTPAGMICLLSTAAPSYDRFNNFEEQGNRFKQAVLQAAGDTHSQARR